jgi:hypothetical protein
MYPSRDQSSAVNTKKLSAFSGQLSALAEKNKKDGMRSGCLRSLPA